MLVYVVVVIMKHRMRDSKVTEEVHESVYVVLSHAIQDIHAWIRIIDLFVSNQLVD